MPWPRWFWFKELVDCSSPYGMSFLKAIPRTEFQLTPLNRVRLMKFLFQLPVVLAAGLIHLIRIQGGIGAGCDNNFAEFMRLCAAGRSSRLNVMNGNEL